MRKVLALLLTLAMILSLTACGSSGEGTKAESQDGSQASAQESQAAPKVDRDDVKIAIGPITDYNPFETFGTDQYAYMNAVYTTLVRIIYDGNGQPQLQGVLAESWDVENDGKTYVFHLKENATFSNGDPVTAEEVKYSYEQAIASPYLPTYTSMIESVEARDEHTFAVNLNGVNNMVPWAWDHLYVVNKAAYEADPEGYVTNPVASGAYTVDKYDEATGNFVLKAREDYWGEAPAIKTVELQVILDSDTKVISLESKEIDLMVTSGTHASQLSGKEGVVLNEAPGNGMGGLFLNCKVAPWDNVKIRQAAAYAMDYAAMSSLLYDGRVSSSSTIPYNSTIDPLPEGIMEYETNIEKAKQLVAESGLPTPIDGGAIIGGGGGAGDLLQQYLAAVGINVTLLDLSGGDYVNALVTGDYSLALIPGASSAITGSQLLVNSFITGGSSNFEQYSNARVDEIAAELAGITDEAQYQAELKEAVEIIAEEIPVVSFGVLAMYTASQAGLEVPVLLNAEIYVSDLSWNK